MAANAISLTETQEPSNHPPASAIEEMTSVISRYLPYFQRIAFRTVGNFADAEDAVQDALLSAYVHLGQFKRNARISTWLTSIVINSARLKVRKRPRQIHLSLDDQDVDHPNYLTSQTLSDLRPGPEELCGRWLLAEKIADLSKTLTPRLRRTFQLRDLDGLGVHETAQILGLKHNTVKARTKRARASIQRKLQSGSRSE